MNRIPGRLWFAVVLLFYAIGPNVQPGTRLAPFENVNIFPLITKILGLQNPEALDSSLAAIAGAYRP
jgi:alkaline phosphatase D